MQRYDYTGVAKAFHWLIALLIFVLFPLAWVMDGFSGLQKFQAYNLHKSLGITVLTLMALRLLWRLASPAPGLPSEMPALEQRAAHAGHFLLYLLLFLMPLSGWLMISASDKPSVLFQFTAFPLLPWIGDLPPDQKKYLAAIFRETHVLLSYTLLALVVIHIAAALRHAFPGHRIRAERVVVGRGGGQRHREEGGEGFGGDLHVGTSGDEASASLHHPGLIRPRSRE